MAGQNVDICERSYEFAVRVVCVCREMDKRPDSSKALTNQLIRSGTSVGANIEEAQGSQSKADFISKMSIACKEARETLYWLRLLVDSEIMTEAEMQSLIREANELVAILTSIVKTTKGKK
jgi:four helix bundle protein